MTTKDSRLDRVNTIIAAIGVVGALVGGFIAYSGLKDKAKLQALSELHSAQLEACQDVAQTASQLYTVKNVNDFNDTMNRFTELKHGKAMLILNNEVVEKMTVLYNNALGFHSDNT
jgi:hypothetical protein